jgi:fatty acid-binding protein DegV
MRRDRITLQNGLELTLSAELIAELEEVVRRWRRQQRAPRRLADEIATYLEKHHAASTIELARALRARDQDVRDALQNDPRFQPLSPPIGTSTRRKSWALASKSTSSVPEARTSPPLAEGDMR